ncbi:MAG: DNA-directed RNA polymerase subunit omega [Chthonomonas sp.]|nr:DNA-directed RNA polymerase subunit omega [Chthonomonas sp.]
MSSNNNSIFPAPDTLNEMECGKYVLANLAAKRAKQLVQGTPLVHIDSRHPLSIALAEIAAGKIRPIVPEEGAEVIIDTTEDIGAELGILLPALDESEVELLGTDIVLDDHEEVIEAETGASITDLLADDAETEVVEPEEDTLSLNELAEQEEGEAEEAEPEA